MNQRPSDEEGSNGSVRLAFDGIGFFHFVPDSLRTLWSFRPAST